jgi:hypothetical protein
MTIDASDAAPGAPRAGRSWRFSLRFSVLAVVLATVALTAAAVHVPWLLASRDNTADMARQLNREILGGVSREVARLLGDAVQAQAAILDMLKEGVVDLDDRPKRDDFMFSFIKTNPHFSWVSFGYRNGDFIGVQRRDQRHYRVVHSLWDPERNVAIRTEDSYVSTTAATSTPRRVPAPRTTSRSNASGTSAPWPRRIVTSGPTSTSSPTVANPG